MKPAANAMSPGIAGTAGTAGIRVSQVGGVKLSVYCVYIYNIDIKKLILYNMYNIDNIDNIYIIDNQPTLHFPSLFFFTSSSAHTYIYKLESNGPSLGKRVCSVAVGIQFVTAIWMALWWSPNASLISTSWLSNTGMSRYESKLCP